MLMTTPAARRPSCWYLLRWVLGETLSTEEEAFLSAYMYRFRFVSLRPSSSGFEDTRPAKEMTLRAWTRCSAHAPGRAPK